jgi:hypothetical protein
MKELVERPQAEKRKIHSKEEFELCYFRHQYLRRVDYNPTLLEMQPYMRIVRRLTRKTFYTYVYLFHTVGMDADCLMNIGRIYLTEFLGLFEFDEKRNIQKYEEFYVNYTKKENKTPGKKEIQEKNKANFTMFMKQRMEDLVRICRQKAKNIKGLQVDEYVAFYGPSKPPSEFYKLIEDNEAYGFKRLDGVAFKAIKKKAKAKVGESFQFAGSWYIAVPLEQRNLTVLDFAGAGLDPHEHYHNMNPERILMNEQQEIRFDKKVKVFKNSPKEEKAKTLFDFIEKNENNPVFEEEIGIAKKYLRNMGIEYARK